MRPGDRAQMGPRSSLGPADTNPQGATATPLLLNPGPGFRARLARGTGQRGSGAVFRAGLTPALGLPPGTRRDGLWRPSLSPGPRRADEDGFLQEEALGRGRKGAGSWGSWGRERGAPWNPCGTF